MTEVIKGLIGWPVSCVFNTITDQTFIRSSSTSVSAVSETKCQNSKQFVQWSCDKHTLWQTLGYHSSDYKDCQAGRLVPPFQRNPLPPPQGQSSKSHSKWNAEWWLTLVSAAFLNRQKMYQRVITISVAGNIFLTGSSRSSNLQSITSKCFLLRYKYTCWVACTLQFSLINPFILPV